MTLFEQAKDFLTQIGAPSKQCNDMCCNVLIALSNMANQTSWANADNPWMGPHDIIVYLDVNGIKSYAENSRETIRKNCLRPFRDLAIIEDNGLASNSGKYKYRLTQEMTDLLRSFQTDEWSVALKYYTKYNNALVHSYQSKKELQKMPVRVNGQDLRFSPGKHNQLQKQILEVFAPKFANGFECLYVGDSADRDMYKNTERLNQLGFDITLDVLPDVVLYVPNKKWLFFIECVTTVGPVDQKRMNDIEAMTQGVDAGNVYVTAFPDFSTYKKFSQDLAWETEVWIAEIPDHLIHLNGDRFLGPHSSK